MAQRFFFFSFSLSLDLSDNPDVGGNSSAHGSVTPPPQALNFGSTGSGDIGLPYMSTESLLRKIQALLKAAADKIRDDDRALNFEKGEGFAKKTIRHIFIFSTLPAVPIEFFYSYGTRGVLSVNSLHVSFTVQYLWLMMMIILIIELPA